MILRQWPQNLLMIIIILVLSNLYGVESKPTYQVSNG